MAKNNSFQIIHILNKGLKNSNGDVYAGLCNSNPNNLSSSDLVTIRINDYDDLKDNGDLVLVKSLIFIHK